MNKTLVLPLLLWTAPVVAQSSANPARTRPVPSSVEGTLSFMWEDRFATHEAVRHTYVFDGATRRRYEVHIDSAMAARFGGYNAMRGRRVRLAAAADGKVSNIASVSALAADPFKISRNIVVLLCKVADSPSPTPTKAQYENMWSKNANSVRAYWREVSAGSLDINVDVTDWGVMPGDQATYDQAHDPTGEKMVRGCHAAHSGIDFTKYDAVALELGLYIGAERGGFGTDTIGNAVKGFGETMSGYIADPEKDAGTHAHEFGHALNLLHSGPRSGDVYGSFWDVMSGSGTPSQPGVTFPAHTLAGHKDTLGFIPASRKYVATGPSTTITLERSAQPAANANYLMALVPTTYNEFGARYYTVELRQKVGFDQSIPREGVLINDYCSAICRAEPYLIVDRDGNANPNDAGAVLAAGETFEDKANHISITVESITGSSARVTIRNGAGYALSIASTGKKTTLPQGAPAIDDQIGIQVGAPTSAGLGWTARNVTERGAGLTVLTPTGTGAGTIRLRRGGTALATGAYIDTVKVSGPASTQNLYYIDTLVVTPAAGLFVGLSMTSHADSNLAGIGHPDTALVRITGPSAAAAQWTATKTMHGLGSMLTTTGTGDGVVRWNRLTSTTNAAGSWVVDTITVSVNGAPSASARIIDSMHVLEPVRYVLSTRGRTDTLYTDSPAKLDSIRVEFLGAWATNATWTLSNAALDPSSFLVPVRNGNTELSTPVWTGVGNGTGYFYRTLVASRGIPALRPGRYIDTLRIRGPLPIANSFSPTHQGEQLMIDTLVVLAGAAAQKGVLRVSATSARDTIAVGLNASMDSVLVTAYTAGGDSVEWSATAPAGITIFRSANSRFAGGGKGPMYLRWSRDVTGAQPGTFVRSIQITSAIGNATVTDTLVVVGSTALSTGMPGRNASSPDGSNAPVPDSVSVTPLGASPSTVAWTASKKKSFTTLTTASGTGAGMLRWRSDPTGLSAGVYVDTITISGPSGVRGGMVVDTLTVLGPLVQNANFIAARFDADSVGGIFGFDFATTLSLNVGSLKQTLRAYTVRLDWDSVIVRLDSVKPGASGFATPTLTRTNGSRVTLTATDAAGKSGNPSLATLYFHFATGGAGRATAITPTFVTATSASGGDLLAQIIASSVRAVLIPGVLRGDVNVDGKLTSADALLLLRSLVGIAPPAGTSFTLTPNGDANCNGKNEAIDVQLILTKLVGLPLPAGVCVGTIK